MIETATRRDLGDEKVIVQCARTIEDIDQLKMLYVLAWADARATGPRAWNTWTANLIQELFFKILNIFLGEELATRDASQRAQETLLAGPKCFSQHGQRRKRRTVFSHVAPVSSKLFAL
jgi:[protein-PII] uridylyltransferase